MARSDYYTQPCICGASPAHHIGHSQACADAHAPTPAHLLPSACFICGGPEHAPVADANGTHGYWSNAAADAEAAEHDRRVAAAGGPLYPSMTAVETLDPREAVYA